MSDHKNITHDLTAHWVLTAALLCLLIIYNVVCHTMSAEIKIDIAKEQIVFIRTILYFIAIILFPIATLLRHILLRLNQTMPGNTAAKSRYFMTTAVTLFLIEIVGVFGLVMFVLGDSYNSLYIFSLLATLGIFLHRPKEEEYRQIIDAIKNQGLKDQQTY